MKITAKDLKSERYQGSFSKQYEGDVEIEGNLGFVSFDNIWCTGSITAGLGTYIYAGTYIDAGTEIRAVDFGITAGYSIICKTTLSAKLRIIAGASPYQDGNNNTITCGKLESGTVVGNLVETGLPDDRPNNNYFNASDSGKFCSECGEKL